MLLKYPSAHFQSLSELKSFSSLQFTHSKNKQLNDFRQAQSSSSLKRQKSEFIPFCKERDLGKLISNKNCCTKQQSASKSLSKNQKIQDLLDIVNFKNFKKLYNMQKKNEQAKYALQVRNSGQKNLINEKEWQVKSLSKRSLSNSSLKEQNQRKMTFSNLRKCCDQNKNAIKGQKYQNQKKFNKIDVQLYKKIAINRPPNNNPQLQKLFEHYVQACQLNQNERRRFLTQRKK